MTKGESKCAVWMIFRKLLRTSVFAISQVRHYAWGYPNIFSPESRSRRLRRLDLAPSTLGRRTPSSLNFPPMLAGLDKTLVQRNAR